MAGARRVRSLKAMISSTHHPPALRQHYGARPFAEATVDDVMMKGIVTCDADTSLGDVARMMTGYGIHCLVVTYQPAEGESPRWGVLSDLDLVAAADTNQTAGEAARTDVVAVPADAPLRRAAQRMADYGVRHLVVADPGSSTPVGIVSTTGITRALAMSRWEEQQ